MNPFNKKPRPVGKPRKPNYGCFAVIILGLVMAVTAPLVRLVPGFISWIFQCPLLP